MENRFTFRECCGGVFFKYRWYLCLLSLIIIPCIGFLFLSTTSVSVQSQDHKLIYSKYTRLTGVINNPSISLVIPDNHQWSGDFLSRIAHEEKTHNLFFNYIANLDNKKYLIIDAGAHVGDTAIWLAKFAKVRGKKVKVLAVDPDNSKIEFINNVVKENKLQDYIVTVNSAIGDNFGKASVIKYYAKNMWSKISLHAGAWRIKDDRSGAIDVVPLDHIYSSLNLDDYALAILHLDVEGGEFKAMQGAIGLLLKDHPLCVFELFDRNNIKRINQVMSVLGFTSSDILRSDNHNEIFYTHSDIAYKKSLKNIGKEQVKSK